MEAYETEEVRSGVEMNRRDPAELSPTRLARLCGRALKLRCPQCGGRGLLKTWLRLREHCPTCGLKLDRGETDHFIGGYTVNFIGAELIVTAFLTVVVLLSWPEVPWDFITYGGAVLAIVMPVVTYPFSRVLWLAIDLAFQPPVSRDFDPTSSVEARAVHGAG